MKTERMTLDAADHLGSSDGKRHFNACHFTESAPRYDIATRGLSLGQDASWKRTLIASLPEIENPVCLDLACGTGDVAFQLADRYRNAAVHAIDLTPAMIELAKRRDVGRRIHFAVGDMSRLEFPDNTIDLVTGSYAIRNAPDLVEALREIHRVLKPGGTAAFLDFSKPRGAMAQACQYHLLRWWGGFWGLALHGNPRIHGYISASLRDFPDEATLAGIFESLRFTHEQSHPLFGGMMRLHLLRKNDPNQP